MRINSGGVSFLVVFGLVFLIAGWILVDWLLIPSLIESAYRGESLEVLNGLISGQAFHPVEHYLSLWNRIYWEVLVSTLVILLIACLSILILNWLGPQRVDDCIQRYKLGYFGAVLLYLIAAHYWFLGFTSYDGFTHRIPPIVELVQHGDLGGNKFDFFNARYFYPFFELLHVPFLKVFGLSGLFFSFSLVLFPLATLAIWWFILELTRDRRWATYGAIIYLSIPFVNEQPFSGYIDFAVIGALAFFLFSLLRILRSDQPSAWRWLCFLIATFVFSMSRQHAPYIALFLFVVIMLWFLGPWPDRSLRRDRSWAGFVFIFALGIAPSIYLHIHRLLAFGSPIYPAQFKFLWIASAAGEPLDNMMRAAGLPAPTWQGTLTAFVRGWLWPGRLLPLFFDSRLLGVGFLLWIGIITLPFIQRAMDREVRFFLLLLITTGLITQNFWLPRFAFPLLLALIIGVGGDLPLLAVKGPRWLYAALLVICVLHILGRPLYVGLGMLSFNSSYHRVNLAGSRWFISGVPDPGALPEIYPDWGADLLIVYPVINKFVLPLYGRHLSNRIIGKLDPATLSGSCGTIRQLEQSSRRKVLVVDQTGLASGQCSWICEMARPWGCMAQRLA
jgi:hypothetical protein